MIGHIAKRIAFVVLGYLAGLLAGAATFPCLLLVISHFNPDSQLWQFLGLGPVAVAVAPVILFTTMWIVLMLTLIPAAILKLLTEIFSLRAIWLHLLVSLLLAAWAGLVLVPEWFTEMTANRWLITLAILLSALVGGLVYWATAGRRAGFRPTTIDHHSPPIEAAGQKESG